MIDINPDAEKQNSFFSDLIPPTILPIQEDVSIDIDVDIEKQITQLQEAKMQTGIKKVVPIDFDTELGMFFSSIDEEKKDLEKKVAKDKKKIIELESLFDTLKKEKKQAKVKKKKVLLVEPEPEPEKLKEEVNEVKAAEKEAAGSLMEYLLPKEVERYDEGIIDRVSKQLSEMQVATELDKDKIKNLKSIDSLEKLKIEFLNFKDIVAKQMGTIGGGGEVRLEFLDDVQRSTALVDGKFLKYSSSDGKFIGADADASSSEFTGVTAGTVTASKGIIVDSNKDIDGFRNVTIEGNLTVEGTTTTIDSTTIEIQNSFKFEGATADAHETNLTTIDPTADRTISLPNATGTIVLKDTTDTLTNKSIDLANNTLTGSLAEFNSALQSESFAGLAATQTLTNKSIDSDNNTITNIVNADIKSSAAIAFSKMENLTVSRALVSDSNGDVSISAVTSTEIGYLDGVTSAIQTQLDAKQATIDASARLDSNLIHDGSISNTEFGHLNNVSSNIQTQLDTKSTKAFAIAQAVALG